MKNTLDKIDLMSLMRLGGKKRGDDKYASFNRRMLAATFDSVLVALFIAPLVDMIFNHVYGVVVFDQAALQQKMQAAPNQQAAMELMWHALSDAGLVTRWFVNSGVQLAILFMLTAYCWRHWSATPGKMLVRIRIVDAKTGQPMTNRQIALRLVGYIPSTLCLFMGFFWIGIDKHRRAWHDMLAGTAVIVMRKEKPPVTSLRA